MTELSQLPRSASEILALSAKPSLSLPEVLIRTSTITDIGVKILDVGETNGKGIRCVHLLKEGAKHAERVRIETLRHWLKQSPSCTKEEAAKRRGHAVNAAKAARDCRVDASHRRELAGTLTDEEKALCRQAAQLMRHMPANRAPYLDWVE